MSDPLKTVRPGDPVQLTARAWNDMAEAARDAKRARATSGASGPVLAPGQANGLVTIRNTTGSAINRFGVLALGDPIIDSTDSEIEFQNRINFDGEASTNPAVDCLAILQEPAAPGMLARAILAGTTPVKIQVTSSTHTHAVAITGDTTKLTSAANGPARILWAEEGTGEKWAYVQLSQGTSDGVAVAYGNGSGTTPVATEVTRLVFRTDYGLTVADAGGGDASVYTFPASDSQWGVVTSTGYQRFGGTKHLTLPTIDSGIAMPPSGAPADPPDGARHLWMTWGSTLHTGVGYVHQFKVLEADARGDGWGGGPGVDLELSNQDLLFLQRDYTAVGGVTTELRLYAENGQHMGLKAVGNALAFVAYGNDGQSATVAGLTFSAGIYTGGTLSVPGSSITGGLDGGTF